MPDLAPHQGSPVSRTRRALFAFVTMLLCWSAIVGLASIRTPVEVDISTNAIHVLGDVGTFVGIAYIGGSVVDYAGMFSSLGRRFGINIPFGRSGDDGAATADVKV